MAPALRLDSLLQALKPLWHAAPRHAWGSKRRRIAGSRVAQQLSSRQLQSAAHRTKPGGCHRPMPLCAHRSTGRLLLLRPRQPPRTPSDNHMVVSGGALQLCQHRHASNSCCHCALPGTLATAVACKPACAHALQASKREPMLGSKQKQAACTMRLLQQLAHRTEVSQKPEIEVAIKQVLVLDGV